MMSAPDQAAPDQNAPAVLQLQDLGRSFAEGNGKLTIFEGLNLDVRAGEMVALIGPSGAGKSTLLQIAGLLEKPTGGEVRIAGQACSALSDADRTALRRRTLGFVYQFHNLLPEFSAVENVALPRRIAGEGAQSAEAVASRLLEHLGLGARLQHRPAELSGGEQQRVAIARALANAPRVVLADEPTGNLDPRTSARVFDALLDVCRGEGVAALIATHNEDLAARMDRVVELTDGRLSPRKL